MKILIAVEWADNYAKIGGATVHLGPEDLATAKREAEEVLGQRAAKREAKPTPAPSPAAPPARPAPVVDRGA